MLRSAFVDASLVHRTAPHGAPTLGAGALVRLDAVLATGARTRRTAFRAVLVVRLECASRPTCGAHIEPLRSTYPTNASAFLGYKAPREHRCTCPDKDHYGKRNGHGRPSVESQGHHKGRDASARKHQPGPSWDTASALEPSGRLVNPLLHGSARSISRIADGPSDASAPRWQGGETMLYRQ